jgi:hypothetical protein
MRIGVPGQARLSLVRQSPLLRGRFSFQVSRVQKVGCTEVGSYSKHWPCLFPQHGPGKKHQRKIELTVWQQELVDLDPAP